jgi:SAM-dependent methyltransferase
MIDLKHRRHFGIEQDLNAVRNYQCITWAYIDNVIQQQGWWRNGYEDEVKVLDVGASEGFLSYLMPYNYTGVDINPLADFVKKGTIYELFTHSYMGRFDVVIYNHVLEHIENPSVEIDDVSLLMKTGSLLFIAVPDASAPWAWEYEGHVSLFNKEILGRMLERCDFTINESFYVTFRKDDKGNDKKELWMTAIRRYNADKEA